MQTKLAISQPRDAFEHEADRAADAVMNIQDVASQSSPHAFKNRRPASDIYTNLRAIEFPVAEVSKEPKRVGCNAAVSRFVQLNPEHVIERYRTDREYRRQFDAAWSARATYSTVPSSK